MMTVPYYQHSGITIYRGDCREVLPALEAGSVHCMVTSPPYWGLRDYGVGGQLGLESTPDEYVSNMVEVFRAVRRVLREDGTLWLNLGDCYNAGRDGGHPGGKKQWRPEQGKYQNRSGANVSGLKPKDLIGIPWRVALALQADGWYLRSDIIWAKPNPMPESVTDRPTKAHEHLFLLTKSARYHYDAAAISEPCGESNAERPRMGQGPNTQYNQKRRSMKKPGSREDKPRGSFGGKNVLPGKEAFRAIRETRNRRDVWTIPTQCYKGAHFATFPEKLVEPCILAGCPEGGVVMDPFSGAGTVAVVAQRLGHGSINIELNTDYCAMAAKRLGQAVLALEG
jgi:DNA modification methylase